MPLTLTPADLTASLPDLTSTFHFGELHSSAIILRDRWGIPHIKADNEHDVFFAQGFATAQDRLFQMDLDRLRCVGRAAEYLGPNALTQDRLMRRRRLGDVAKRDYALASNEARAAIDAYTAGVNAFIRSSKTLPVEYKLLGTEPERWEPWHCVAVFKVRNTAEGTFQGKLWLSRLAAEIGVERAAKLSPGYSLGGLLTIPPGARNRTAIDNAVAELQAVVNMTTMLANCDGGSNGWALSGEHTEGGLPLVAGESHRGLEALNVYYQVHLACDALNIIGYAIPGFPLLLHFCHNDDVAWGMTYGGVDTQDLFVERFRERDNRLEYQSGDDWLPASSHTELIRVRGAERAAVEIVVTRHGPVIAGEPRAGAAITLADPGAGDATPWIDGAYQAMKARSADELEAALDSWTDRVNNYVYADIHGNFGHALKGRVPIRQQANGWGLVSGWSGKHEWAGYIPAAELPRIRNPAAGWVVSCNQRLVDDSYPHYLTNFCSTGYRAERIALRIGQLIDRAAHVRHKANVTDMESLHGDVIAIPAQSLQRGLQRLDQQSGQVGTAVRMLLDWDCAITVDSASAALYEMTVAKLSEQLARAHYETRAADLLKGLDAGAEEHWRRNLRARLFIALEQNDESWAPPGETWGSTLCAALQEAFAELELRLGANPRLWRWGDLHRTRQQHPLAALFPEAATHLNPPSVPTPGDGDTPFHSGWSLGGSFLTLTGPVNRYVHDPSNWSNSRWIVPLGASGHPGSAHHADQQQLWASCQTIPQLWDWNEIAAQSETEQRLEPLG